MSIATLLPLVLKGISIAEAVWDNRELAFKAIGAIKNLVSNKEPTAEQMAVTDMELDALLDEFNASLPPE